MLLFPKAMNRMVHSMPFLKALPEKTPSQGNYKLPEVYSQFALLLLRWLLQNWIGMFMFWKERWNVEHGGPVMVPTVTWKCSQVLQTKLTLTAVLSHVSKPKCVRLFMHNAICFAVPQSGRRSGSFFDARNKVKEEKKQNERKNRGAARMHSAEGRRSQLSLQGPARLWNTVRIKCQAEL